MKKSILVLYFISNLFVFSKEFNLTPLVINFSNIITKDSLIIAYGDFGSIFLSKDNGKKWDQIKIFNTGEVIKIFNKVNNSLIAFSSNGEIKKSTNNGLNWEQVLKLQDTLTEVIEYYNGYALRTNKNLTLLSENYNILKSTNIPKTSIFYSNQFGKSLVALKSNLYLSIDSSSVLKFNSNLIQIDSISFLKRKACKFCGGRIELQTDSSLIYVRFEDSVFTTNDFINFNKIFTYSGYVYFEVQNNKKYVLERSGSKFYFNYVLYEVDKNNQYLYISKFESLYYDNRFSKLNQLVNKIQISDDKVIMAGDAKFLVVANLKDTVASLVSQFHYSPHIEPEIVNDSLYIYYNNFYLSDNNFYNTSHCYLMYQTKNKGFTFQPLIDTNYYKMLENIWFDFKFYDKFENKIVLGGFEYNGVLKGLFISNDFGRNFTYKDMQWYNFGNVLGPIANFQITKDKYITAYKSSSFSSESSYIVEFDKNFDNLRHYKENDIAIYYINSVDTNNYLIENLNLIDTTFEIKYTKDQFKNWNVLKKYNRKDSLLYNKEITLENRTFLCVGMINYTDSIISFDLIDLENRKVYDLYSYKTNTSIYENTLKNAICSDSNVFYLAINDTLFSSNDYKDKSNWKKYILPNNGSITRNLRKVENKFYAYYSDDLHKQNAYWIELRDFSIKKYSEIEAIDRDFGKIDIKDKSSVTRDVYIGNNSKTEKLEVYSYLANIDSAFTTNLPKIDKSNPLIIDPSTYYHFLVTFKPNKVKKYNDSIIFHSNAIISDSITYLRGEGIDTVKSSVTEEYSYFYSWDPYPIPGVNQIKFNANWDSSSDIDTDKKIVFDLFGNEIGKSSDLKLIKNAPFSGYFVWDCTNILTGIYIIQINHGTSKNFIPVMVVR